ncbi:protein DEK [Caerostris extrusa]|uniref:Protein DEK n=1 Tax=Caerostris extrusa TaxID=172846 RepID=A0AAV4QDG5_CAEEX|nr:protein DEK [Caerostris extrusa]
MSDTKDESNSTTSDVKEEESSPKTEEAKSVDESSKDSEKDSIKDENVKEESGKEGSEKDGSSDKESSDDEDALFDRPVEQVGCRARKQVERLEISFNTPKEKHEIKAGKGQKLGECPRIEHQIQKTSIEDLKPVHKILFGRVGSASQIKKSIRKFSGFPFGKSSSEFKRKRAFAEKLTANVLKRICEVLDLERSGSKEEIIKRILGFLLEPKDSGKKVKSKNKGSTKDKGKNSEKKPKSIKKPKAKKASSDEETSINDSASEKEDEEEEQDEQVDDDDDSDYDAKKKAKKNPKAKKTPPKTVAKQSDKKGKAKKEEKKSTGKGTKRKREDDDDSASDTETDSSDEEPIAKKRKMPSDEEIKKLVKKILDAADLQQITMKKVIKQIADAYPDCDLSHKKAFIKSTVKSLLGKMKWKQEKSNAVL